MTILYYDPITQADDVAAGLGAHKVDFDTLLRQSDFVTMHTPLTEETRHLMSGPQFDRMKSSAYLINTARGPIVDEAALADALVEGKIRGAALDVFEDEPRANPRLIPLDNVILTPHIASASVETRTKMAATAAENVIAAVEGKRPPTVVNPEVLG
jgi:glyoxylate reductase